MLSTIKEIIHVPDLINSCFEFFSGLSVFLHCRKTWVDKKVRGVSIISLWFFVLWGYWNLFYYPHLDQWLSFAGGVIVTTANTLWLGQVLYYNSKEKKHLLGGETNEI